MHGKYCFDCRKCTNVYTQHPRTKETGQRWCRPIVDGLRPIQVNGTSGRDYVLTCEYYRPPVSAQK